MMVDESARETAVVGLDAATWRVIDPLLERGALPNIAALIEDGTRGRLESTTPPMTPLAWTSIASGANPGKHGIYDFVTQDADSYRIRPTEYGDVACPTVWDVFDAANRRVGVVNYPMVYPPHEVDSFFVSGFPAPDDNVLAYPTSVGKRLRDMNYRIHPSTDPSDGAKAYYEDIVDLSRTQCDATLTLLDSHDVELLVTVFMGIDWIQHYLWNETIDGENAVELFYQEMDTLIGRLRTSLNDGWRIVLLSDHGARKIDREIHLNSLLAEWGMLKPTDPDLGLSERAKDAFLQAVYRFGSHLPEAIKGRLREQTDQALLNQMREAAGRNQLDMHRRIDWEHTEAFAYGNMGRVFINRSEVYSNGTVSSTIYEQKRTELIERFESLTDPESGNRLVEKAVRGEELYSGPEARYGADIVLVPRGWKSMLYGDFGDEWIHAPSIRVADHDPDGLLVMAGPGIKSGTVSATVTDIAPTLLWMHNLPLIEEMDGDVLDDALVGSPESPPTRPAESVFERTISGAGNTDIAEDRLSDLGYL